MRILKESIEVQLALYTNISGSLSPVKNRTCKSPVSHDNRVAIAPIRPPHISQLSKTSINESIDSEYELTLL